MTGRDGVPAVRRQKGERKQSPSLFTVLPADLELTP